MNILHQFFQISTQVAATDDSIRSFLTKLMTNFSALLKMFRDPDLALRRIHLVFETPNGAPMRHVTRHLFP